VALALAGLFVAWLGSSVAMAWHLTGRPHAWRAEPRPELPGIEVSAPRLETADGLTLGSWSFHAGGDGPGVILLHGWGGSRSVRLPHAQAFLSAGCAVLAVTLRAHGDSAGEHNDAGWGARRDVVAAVEYLERTRPGRPIVVCGASAGAAAAIFAAAELGQRVAGYVLECPYRDLRSAVHHRTRYYLPPGVDRVAALGLDLCAPLFIDDIDAIAPIEHARAIPRSTPVLVLAGGRDERAPLAEVREVQSAIGPHARLVVFEEATHDRLLESDRAQYGRVVGEFVRELTVLSAPALRMSPKGSPPPR